MKNKLYYQAAASTTLLLFVVICYLLRFYPATLAKFDRPIIQTVHQWTFFNGFFLWVTKFANPMTVAILIPVFLFVFFYTKQKIPGIWFAASLLLMSGIINPLLKQFFQRARPTILPHLVTEHSLSFPSGHAITSTILYGSLLFMLPLFFRNKSLRLMGQILLGGLILSICVSRIYLGVHYPSDVLAGFLLGISWLLFSFPYYREQKLINDMKQIGRQKNV